MIANSERTPAVIRSAMMKHGLEGSPENFTLSQLLPENGESFAGNAAYDTSEFPRITIRGPLSLRIWVDFFLEYDRKP